MIFALAALLYAAAGCAVYLIFNKKNRKAPVFRMPKSRALYLLLSLTWGLPMTLIGACAALGLILVGKKPAIYGRNVAFFLKNVDFGVSLGLFMIVPEGCEEKLYMHEHGHSIQNVYMGPLMPLVVSLPSFVRYHARRLSAKKNGRAPKTPYDAVWFEGSATKSGEIFINDLKNKTKNMRDIQK